VDVQALSPEWESNRSQDDCERDLLAPEVDRARAEGERICVALL
jgi:hypothetical protein